MDRLGNLSFRALINLLSLALTLLAIAASTIFFINLYQRDRIASLLESERSNTNQFAGYLRNLLSFADTIDPRKVRDSEQIIALFENVCSHLPRPDANVASVYEEHLTKLEVDPYQLFDEKALFDACKPSTARAVIIQNGVRLPVPYLNILLRPEAPPAPGADGTRLVSVSLDGFTTSLNNTVFIANPTGTIEWSADGVDFVKKAMEDTELFSQEYLGLAKRASESQNTEVSQGGRFGIMSYTRLPIGATNDAILSLSYQPTMVQPVHYVISLSLLLVSGLFFLCILLGSVFAKIVTRPFEELRKFAGALAAGQFHFELAMNGPSEISSVKHALTSMAARLVQLMESNRTQGQLETELRLAEQVQKMLLPATLVEVGDFTVASYGKNAARCGGDWWGYTELARPGQKNILLTLIGDVTGHDVGSALITGIARGALAMLDAWIKTNPELIQNPAKILEHYNKTIHDVTKGSMGMTLFVALFDPDASTLSCANAGHNFPYLLRGDKILPVGSDGVPLGSAPDTAYTRFDTYPIEPGSKLFMYTDGLIECPNAEDENQFERKDLRKALQKSATKPAKLLLDSVLRERAAAVANLPQADDVTVAVIEWSKRKK